MNSSTEKTIHYFSQPGKENTQKTLELAVERALMLQLQAILIATKSGETALRLSEIAQASHYEGRIIAVTYHQGFFNDESSTIPKDVQKLLFEKDIPIVMSSHALSGVSRSFREKFGGISIPEIIAESFRRISQGFKVAVEISIMAADAGAVSSSQDVVAIGGQSQGADTALVLRPAHQNSFLNLKIKEVICFPS
ncbi:MAG: hypothetical protein GX432_08270 [Candidatus Atribacteria bacterium]|jgi:hypothetical protein|nr:hypothetical protein [Candidatus Atribacteria bacterium]